MMILIFYLGALGLFGLGALLIRKTSPYTRKGGIKFERRMKRRTLGAVLLMAGALLLGLAVLTQFFSSHH
jgi:O-antigen/teichoic acid export membrane protein